MNHLPIDSDWIDLQPYEDACQIAEAAGVNIEFTAQQFRAVLNYARKLESDKNTWRWNGWKADAPAAVDIHDYPVAGTA